MSTVIHPVGPEPSEKYWVRRAVVVGVALLLVIVFLVALFNRNAGQQPAPASPPGTPTLVPTPAAPSARPSVSSSVTASSTASGKASTTATAKASTKASGSASGKPTTSTSGKASATPSTKPSATPSTQPSGSASSTASAGSTASSSGSSSASPSAGASGTPSASAKTTATPTAAANQNTLVVCDPAQLRPTLTAAERSVKAKKPLAFNLSLINGSASTCVVTVKSTDFELKIYSGKDRVWSTNDCSTLVDPKLTEVKPEQSVQWKISWNGRRSAKGCGNRSEIPRAGTYWATAQFVGSKPVQFRFLVK